MKHYPRRTPPKPILKALRIPLTQPSENPKEVYKFVLTYGWAILGASFGPQMILVLLWRRASYAGCIAGMLTGFATALIWQQTYGAQTRDIEVYNLPIAFVAALIVNVVVSLLTPGRTAVSAPLPEPHAEG